jgi:ParB-like nuclease domain
MKLVELELNDLVISEELSRSGSAKQFEERLKSSIEEIGLVEPIKVAPLPTGRYVVVDGIIRLKAIASLREADPTTFLRIPAYVLDYDRRYELRYQTDIYQDLLPSQLAALVEHLHKTEHVRKADIARYIGVSPATLRNYTGLWRLLQRGGLFAKVVELMDVEVIPSSNPYAWLRLTAAGLRYVIEHNFSEGEEAEPWIERCILEARRGKTLRFTIKYVEATTDALPAEYYRQGEELRTVKRDLGLRRAAQAQLELNTHDASDIVLGLGYAAQPKPKAHGISDAIRHLSRVSRRSQDPVLRSAARSLRAYLR